MTTALNHTTQEGAVPWLVQLRCLDAHFPTRRDLAHALDVTDETVSHWLPADDSEPKHEPRPDTRLLIGRLYGDLLSEDSSGLEALIAASQTCDRVLAADSLEEARIAAVHCKAFVGRLLAKLQPEPRT